MLIQEILNLLTPDITALGWVERFGGVTRLLTMGFGENERGIMQYKTFPISCSVSDVDCVQNQRYQDLVPDSSKKSVLYWEVEQGLTDSGQLRERRNLRSLRGRAKLIGWLNTDLLGVNECNTAAKAARSILPILYKQITAGNAGALFDKATVDFQFSGEAVKDKAIFSHYNYGSDVDAYLLHPYDFFALTVDIQVNMPLCDYTFETSTPIDCTDYSAL